MHELVLKRLYNKYCTLIKKKKKNTIMLYEFSGIFQFSLLSFFVVIYVQTLFMVLDLFNYNREVNLY